MNISYYLVQYKVMARYPGTTVEVCYELMFQEQSSYCIGDYKKSDFPTSK